MLKILVLKLHSLSQTIAIIFIFYIKKELTLAFSLN